MPDALQGRLQGGQSLSRQGRGLIAPGGRGAAEGRAEHRGDPVVLPGPGPVDSRARGRDPQGLAVAPDYTGPVVGRAIPIRWSLGVEVQPADQGGIGRQSGTDLVEGPGLAGALAVLGIQLVLQGDELAAEGALLLPLE